MDPHEAWKVLEIATQPQVHLSRTDYVRCDQALNVLGELVKKYCPKPEEKKPDGK